MTRPPGEARLIRNYPCFTALFAANAWLSENASCFANAVAITWAVPTTT